MERKKQQAIDDRKKKDEEAAAQKQKKEDELKAKKAEQEQLIEEKRKAAEEKARAEAEAKAADLRRRDAIRASIGAIRFAPREPAQKFWTPLLQRQARALPQTVVPPDIGQRLLGPKLTAPALPLAIGKAAINLAIRPAQNYGPAEATPLRWAGRLFFTGPDGPAYCSAQFIAPNVLLTAAHCVRDNVTGAYHNNIGFALQYNSGVYSQFYTPLCVAAPKDYVQEGEGKYRWDYALIYTDAPSRTGYFGWALGAPSADDRATAIGYPHDMAEGEVIQVEAGEIELYNDIIAVKVPDAAFGKGSSGGARILKYDTGGAAGANVVFSVNSYLILDRPGHSFGPTLGEPFKNLFEYVANGCKD